MSDANRNLQQEFESVVKDVISPIFKRMKFKKRNNNFNRRINDIVQVFNIQKSQWNDIHDVEFTFNLGFFSEMMYRLAWDRKVVPEFVREYDCFLSARLGVLTHKKDHWYRITMDTDPDEIRHNVYYDITRFAEPLFEKYLSLKSFKEIFNNPPTNEPLQFVGMLYYRIIYFMENDQRTEGEELLRESYEDAQLPKSVTLIIVNPGGEQEIRNSEPEVDQYYIDCIKRLAHHYGIVL